MWDSIVSGFTSVVDTFSGAGGNSLVSDAINGAIVGGVSSWAAGGKFGEGAAYGAVGGAVAGGGDTGIFGEYGNEVGAAITGYGVDKSRGGSGLLGAGAAGLLAHAMEDDPLASQGVSEAAAGGTGGTGNSAPVADVVDPVAGGTSLGGGSEEGLLARFGLENTNGTSTMLGKAALGALANYGASEQASEEREDQAKYIKQAKEDTKELDERFRQRDLRAFSGPAIVARNG